MAGEVENRLKDNGITLPNAAAPAGSYVPTVRTGNLLFVSGQVPFGPDGKIQFVGKVGDDTDVETAQAAARLCAINILAQVKAALGDLDSVVRCVKLTGFVNCTPDFTAHPTVINGASDLMAVAFGDAGRHARAAVGSAALPLGVAVEVEAIFEVA